MTRGTRYVVLGGVGLLAAGLAAGLAAWVTSGLPALLLAQGRPDELRYVPADATIVSFANVREVMDSELRERLRERESETEGPREFEARTGIDIDRDVDHIVAGLVPTGRDGADAIAVLAGRFDTGRIESSAIAAGGIRITHDGQTLILIERSSDNAENDTTALTFLDPGVLVIGSESLVRQAIDGSADGADTNDRLMDLLEHVDAGSTAWTVGRLDAADGSGWLPDPLQSQVSQVSAFAVGGQVNGGVRGRLTAEAADETTSQSLRDLLQGFLALGRLQAAQRPELAGLFDALQLTAEGRMVTLSFDLPADTLLELLPAPATRSDGAP